MDGVRRGIFSKRLTEKKMERTKDCGGVKFIWDE